MQEQKQWVYPTLFLKITLFSPKNEEVTWIKKLLDWWYPEFLDIGSSESTVIQLSLGRSKFWNTVLLRGHIKGNPIHRILFRTHWIEKSRIIWTLMFGCPIQSYRFNLIDKEDNVCVLATQNKERWCLLGRIGIRDLPIWNPV